MQNVHGVQSRVNGRTLNTSCWQLMSFHVVFVLGTVLKGKEARKRLELASRIKPNRAHAFILRRACHACIHLFGCCSRLYIAVSRGRGSQ